MSSGAWSVITEDRTGDTVDGLSGKEGAFLPCSYWLADALALAGRTGEARVLFERLLRLRNDLGLISEEYDVDRGRMCGNFPQAFTHLSLIGTAHRLDATAQGKAGELGAGVAASATAAALAG